jgi:adenine phosphoribosyltransferase
MKTHRIEVGPVVRELPVVDVGGVSIALLNLLGDTELVEAAAERLAERMPEGVEALVTPEVKAVPLAHALSRLTGLPYVVVRKTEKPYMIDARTRTVVSITTGKPQDLVLDGGDVPRLQERSVVIVDDVVSTGGTLHGLVELLADVGANVAATMVVFTEGEPRDDVVSLGHLPLYPAG